MNRSDRPAADLIAADTLTDLSLLPATRRSPGAYVPTWVAEAFADAANGRIQRPTERRNVALRTLSYLWYGGTDH